MLVQHAVETPSLILIPVDAVLDVLGGVASEVVCEYQTLASIPYHGHSSWSLFQIGSFGWWISKFSCCS
jgi:hypothetical protein